MYSQIDDRLAHLTPGQIEELISRYYAGDSIKTLIEVYQVACTESRLCSLFPPLVLQRRTCPHCSSRMALKRQARTTNRNESTGIYCPNCDHLDDIRCKCPGCVIDQEQKKKVERLRERELIAMLCSNWDVEPTGKLSVQDLSLRQAVALLSLVRACSYRHRIKARNSDWRQRVLRPGVRPTLC